MRLAFAATLLTLPIFAVMAAAETDQQKLVRYGEQLAQECVTCHRRDGKDDGIPSIIYLSEEEFVTALNLYKTGQRRNKVMVSVAASLDETQMRALAAYLTSLGKAPANAPPVPPNPPRPKPALAPFP